MIDKPTIIITSGGRTGTMFFSRLFNNILDDCISLHEPENIQYEKNKYFIDIKHAIWVFKEFGFCNSVVKKMQGKWGITSISNRRIKNSLTINEAASLLEKERKRLIESYKKKVYVESSYHFYGLIDIVPKVFSDCNTIYITRDGRDWIRSHIDNKSFYGKMSFHTIFDTRISPGREDGEYFKKWKNMDQFEKLCWAWSEINQYALKTMKENPRVKLFYFEDIFTSKSNYDNLRKLIEFSVNFSDVKLPYKSFEGLLDKRINKPVKYKFPSFNNWTKIQRDQFIRICKSTMDILGYDIN